MSIFIYLGFRQWNYICNSKCNIISDYGTLKMFQLIIVLCVSVSVCSSTCSHQICAVDPPPAFPMREPPRPPKLSHVQLVCPAPIEQESGTGKKALNAGVIVFIVLAILLFVFGSVLSWFFTRKKCGQYQTDTKNSVHENEETTKHASHSRSTVNRCYGGLRICWSTACRIFRSSMEYCHCSSCKRSGLKTVQQTDASLASLSSESGYCEELEEIQKGSPPVVQQRRKTKASNETDMNTSNTPDIIASTQGQPRETKRWSLFGLLPSLKPTLVSRGLDTNVSDDIALNDYGCQDDTVGASKAHLTAMTEKLNKTENETSDQNCEVLGSLPKSAEKVSLFNFEKDGQFDKSQCDQQQPLDNINNGRGKKSRVRIRQNNSDHAYEVDV